MPAIAGAAMELHPCTWTTVDGKDGRKFRIERMLEADYEQCLLTVQEAFTNRNQMVAALGGIDSAVKTGGDKYTEREYRHNCLNSGLSLVARDDASGALAAFLFIEPFNMSVEEHSPDRVTQVLVEMGLGLYFSAWRQGHKGMFAAALRGKVLHVNTGATVAEYEGTGVGMALRQYVETHAAKHGFERVTVEPAHPATRHIWEKKLGYSVCISLVLNTYTGKDGTRPFEGLEPNQEIAICEKILRKRCALVDAPPLAVYWGLRLVQQL